MIVQDPNGFSKERFDQDAWISYSKAQELRGRLFTSLEGWWKFIHPVRAGRFFGPVRPRAKPGARSTIDEPWPCHAPVGASRVASIALLYACRRHYPGGIGRCSRHSLPDRWQPSPYSRRVGFRVTRFEACSAFTRVAAHMLAEPPMAALTVEVLQTILLPPSSAPTASG